NRKPCKGLNRVPIARYDDLAIIYGNSGATGKGARGINDPVPIEDDVFDIDKELEDEDSIHYEVNATMEAGEEIEKEVQGSEVAQNKEKGQASVSSKPKNKRRRVGEVEADSVSVGKEIIAELKPMMEVFTASLGDALRGETVVEQEPVQDELVRMRNDIQDELEKLDGLTLVEKIRAALILVDSVPKLELFYRQKEDQRELFVKCLLGQF
ncbi:hypothetical protein LINGRAPRIM_LOCUS3404, partial [Linum grandiflorum]